MTHYFFHMICGDCRIPDPEGLEMADLEAARGEAIAGARSMLSAAVLDGMLPLDERIEIADGDGQLLLVVTFLEAISIGTGAREHGDRAAQWPG